MSKHKVNSNTQFILLNVLFLILILLSLVNINNIFYKPKDVLGAETEGGQVEFWGQYLKYNPNYIPGWVETGQIDKVREINPNYQITDSYN